MMINVIELKRKVIDAFLISQTRFVSTSFNKISKIYTGESTNADEKIKYSIKTDSCYPYISTKDISMNGLVDYENGMYIPKKITKFSIAPANSVLMCIEGGNAGNKIAIINQPICFVNKLCCFDTTGADNRFIYYYLLSNQFRSNFKGQMTGLIGGVSVKKIKELLLPLPDISEQKRIADKLDEIFAELDKIDEKQIRLATIQEKMEAKILKLAIQGKLVEQRHEEGTGEELFKLIQQEKQKLFSEGKIKKEKTLPAIEDIEIPFEIPSSWKWVRLAQIVYNHGQKTPDSDFSYIDIGSIDNINHRLNKDENIIKPENAPSRARKIVNKGDIVYSTVRPYLHNVAIIDKDFSKEPIASTGFAILSCTDGIVNKYLFRCLLSSYFDNYANKEGNAKGVMYPAISDDRLSKALIPLPPSEEQRRIIGKIEELLPLCKGN